MWPVTQVHERILRPSGASWTLSGWGSDLLGQGDMTGEHNDAATLSEKMEHGTQAGDDFRNGFSC